MQDFKLKLILSMLAGVIFSFVFIVLAFALPIKEKKVTKVIPQTVLEKVSQAARDK